MNSFEQLESRLREELVQFLWDQWVTIGVAGAATRKRVPFVIDPEALLLATTRFARDESRLLGEVLDWLLLNGKSMSIARLKTLQLHFQYGEVDGLLEIADQLAARSHKNWKTLHSLRHGGETRRQSTLFPEAPGLRGMSTRPDAGERAAFLFKMRALFGMSARAEILTWLLTHAKGHPAAIARETGWFSKTVQAALNEMQRSGHVHSRQDGREKTFSLTPGEWAALTPLPGTPVGWLHQGAFYGACEAILEGLAAAGRVAGNGRLVSIELQPWLRSTTIFLDAAGDLGAPFARLESLRGEEVAEAYMSEVETFIEQRVSGRALLMNPFSYGAEHIDPGFYEAGVERGNFE